MKRMVLDIEVLEVTTTPDKERDYTERLLYSIFSEVNVLPFGREDDYEIEVAPEDYKRLEARRDEIIPGMETDAPRMAGVRIRENKELTEGVFRVCHRVTVIAVPDLADEDEDPLEPLREARDPWH